MLCFRFAFRKLEYNVLQIGGRFNAANVLLGDRYFLCGGIYKY